MPKPNANSRPRLISTAWPWAHKTKRPAQIAVSHMSGGRPVLLIVPGTIVENDSHDLGSQWADLGYCNL